MLRPLLTTLLILGAAPALAQPKADPDWPCAQRKVSTLGPGAIWTGPDPTQALAEWGNDTDAALLATHYVRYGRLEGRGTGFDARAYLAANPDVAAAVRGGAIRSGYEHYRLIGEREGRRGGLPAAAGKAVHAVGK